MVAVDKARAGLKDRWRNLKKSNSENKERSDYQDEEVEHQDYPRHVWSLAEDHALEWAVSVYGTSWKDIHDNTKMFREMYDHLPGACTMIERHFL